MADVRLLSSPKQSGDFSPALSEDEDSFDSDPPQYKAKRSEFSLDESYRFKPSTKLPDFLQVKGRRLRVALASFGAVVVLCLCLALIIPHLGQRKVFKSKLPKLNPSHRTLACTTWSEDEVEQTASLWTPSSYPPTAPSSPAGDVREWTKPEGFKIVALIFYGRREYVDILDCYLRRNLVSQGGYLDEVHFVANARDPKDSEWLDSLLETADEYQKIEVPDRCNVSISWASCLWDLAADRETMYLKIDDDILYIHPDTIPSLVETRLREKEAFAIGANIVNIVSSAWTHYHNGAIHPYLPEPNVTEVGDAGITWRSSELPLYPEEVTHFFKTKGRLNHMHPPFHGHRWLRLNESGNDLKKTPIAMIENNDHSVARHWAVDAQQQYSLLENIENNQLGLYHVGGRNGIWNTQYHRYNINFLALWGSDVADNLPFDINSQTAFDEKLISILLPLQLARPFLVDSRAIALHYAFHTELEIVQTDLLDRWRAYANEMICETYRKPLGRTCKGVW